MKTKIPPVFNWHCHCRSFTDNNNRLKTMRDDKKNKKKTCLLGSFLQNSKSICFPFLCKVIIYERFKVQHSFLTLKNILWQE